MIYFKGIVKCHSPGDFYIGIAEQLSDYNSRTAYDIKNAYALRCQNGHIYEYQKFQKYCRCVQSGDEIGLFVNLKEGNIFFEINGKK